MLAIIDTISIISGKIVPNDKTHRFCIMQCAYRKAYDIHLAKCYVYSIHTQIEWQIIRLTHTHTQSTILTVLNNMPAL